MHSACEGEVARNIKAVGIVVRSGDPFGKACIETDYIRNQYQL